MSETRSRLGHDPRSVSHDEVSASLETLREPGFVTSFLYFFKPPFPSDGGCAAASAGRSGSVRPTAGPVPWSTHWVPLRRPRFSVARPSGLGPRLIAFAVPVVALAATGAAAVFRCYRFL